MSVSGIDQENLDYKDSDRRIFDGELRDFLPNKFFDAHLHLFDASCLKPGVRYEGKHVYAKFGGTFPVESMLAYAEALLPEQEFYFNSFGQPCPESDLDASAAYTGKISVPERAYGMALVSPHDDIAVVRQRVEANGLVGYKPYVDFVDWKKSAEIEIFDMLPEAQMEYAESRGLAITLHIPRPGRLADPVNQRQMVELCRLYPGVKVIFAHIGRAYYLSGVEGMLEGIAACPNAYIDTAMVNHEGVLEYAFRNFPRERILFASDAPIALLRGKSVEINNQYAYLMGEDYQIGTSLYDQAQAVHFTSFYYEQLRGIKLAAERAGLLRHEIENLFFGNAFALFSQIVVS